MTYAFRDLTITSCGFDAAGYPRWRARSIDGLGPAASAVVEFISSRETTPEFLAYYARRELAPGRRIRPRTINGHEE